MLIGFGFVTSKESHRDFFFHHTSVYPPTTTVEKGQRVEFDLTKGYKGAMATKVTPSPLNASSLNYVHCQEYRDSIIVTDNNTKGTKDNSPRTRPHKLCMDAYYILVVFYIIRSVYRLQMWR